MHLKRLMWLLFVHNRTISLFVCPLNLWLAFQNFQSGIGKDTIDVTLIARRCTRRTGMLPSVRIYGWRMCHIIIITFYPFFIKCKTSYVIIFLLIKISHLKNCQILVSIVIRRVFFQTTSHRRLSCVEDVFPCISCFFTSVAISLNFLFVA